MGSDVHLQSSQGDVNFLAVFAREWFPWTFPGSAVKLSVFGQPRKGRVTLSTIRTLMSCSLSSFNTLWEIFSGGWWRWSRRGSWTKRTLVHWRIWHRPQSKRSQRLSWNMRWWTRAFTTIVWRWWSHWVIFRIIRHWKICWWVNWSNTSMPISWGIMNRFRTHWCKVWNRVRWFRFCWVHWWYDWSWW